MTLMVGHTFVFSPPVRKVKELLDAGLIGPIYYVETTRVNLGLFQKDVSVLWDLGPHDVSILLYWLGEVPIQVSGRGRSYLGEALEDVAFVTLEFPSGILAQVQISWLAPSKLRRTSVVGRQRMIVYDDLEPVEKVKIYDRGVDRQPASFGEFQLTYRSGDILSPRLDTTEPLYLESAHFLECIQTGRVPDTSPRTGVDVVRVIEAAERSMRAGGAPQPVYDALAIERRP
jgi:predicted dehydrogenase